MPVYSACGKDALADGSMRLKLVELQGYKTFASRTEFSFDSGITAIVGPNGSGKTNIADAIRWVLGEQSYRALRGKRTEDMIFAGSTQRSRLGMASASLVLDNADGWLPTDFSEVRITRRAYRSGENEYLLNGRRVRLRDITELLSRSGLAQRTYTVIGQGLVDDVLSLRPEDRRTLFEEAAGIALYRAKRAEALVRMDETSTNLLRVNDIIHEIAPRLERLEQAAARAERHALLSQQLEGLLRTWYGYRWRQAQLNLRRARDSQSRREERLGRVRDVLDRLDSRLAFLRTRQSQLREQLGAWHRESSGLHRQMESVQRELAVNQERDRLLVRSSDEARRELADLDVLLQATLSRVEAAEEDLEAANANRRDKLGLVETLQKELRDHETIREEHTRQLTDSKNHGSDLAARSVDSHNRLAQLAERRSALSLERDDHLEAIARQKQVIAETQSQIEAVSHQQQQLEEADSALEAETTRLNASLVQGLADLDRKRTEMAEAQRNLERLDARLDILSRTRREGAGLNEGVRAVLQAAGSGRWDGEGQLSGIVGTVAQLLRVPPQVETAVEAALAGHLHDIVVRTWADAQAATSFLHETRQGRARLLPLDTLRMPERLTAPGDHRILGIAADLVGADAECEPVIEMLLGRTLIVEDLETARQVFSRLQGSYQIVTLSGDVLHSTGSLAGGKGPGSGRGQALAREREWRELPGSLESARRSLRDAEAALAGSAESERQIRASLSALELRRRKHAGQMAGVQARLSTLGQAVAVAAEQVAWRQGLVARLDAEEADLDSRASELQADIDALRREKASAERQVLVIQERLDSLKGDALYDRLAQARTAAAVAGGTYEHRQATLDDLRSNLDRARSQKEGKRQHITALSAERSAVADQISAGESRELVIKGWLSSLNQKIEPAETEIARLEMEREELVQEETVARAELREAERRHAEAVLAASQQEDRLRRLRSQIMDDFGLVEMEPMEGVPDQPPLPMVGLVSAVRAVETLPEGLENEIHQIRAQINRMGSINPTAPEEYAETRKRSDFLTEQAADLQEAAGRLREVIAELDEVIHREFDRAFTAGAARFRENFTELFGGGTARLVLTDPDDPSHTGVEILARPPGKRQQTLAMLSGGERALTAVALIFALLETSPPPFCILDEVDAMLDEANVQRFRQKLEQVSGQTQFIVITHNRGTVEAANIIYGVSMGDDSVSQVVSLRLDGDAVVPGDS